MVCRMILGADPLTHRRLKGCMFLFRQIKTLRFCFGIFCRNKNKPFYGYKKQRIGVLKAAPFFWAALTGI